MSDDRQELARFYDALSHHSLTEGSTSSGQDVYSMHRVLSDPRSPSRPADQTVLNEIVAEHIADGAYILDAGCGWGGTLFHLAEARGASGVGLTLSGVQAGRARARAADLGISDRLTITVADYNRVQPDGRPFDAVTMIETLHHNPDHARTLRGLAAVLAPGGRFVIVDDFLADDRVLDDGRCRRFRDGWQLPSLSTIGALLSDLANIGFSRTQVRDLTGCYQPRRRNETDGLIEAADDQLRSLAEGASDEAADLRGLIGGYCLEQLYEDGMMQYALIDVSR